MTIRLKVFLKMYKLKSMVRIMVARNSIKEPMRLSKFSISNTIDLPMKMATSIAILIISTIALEQKNIL